MTKTVRKFATAQGADKYVKKVIKEGNRYMVKWIVHSSKPYHVTVWKQMKLIPTKKLQAKRKPKTRRNIGYNLLRKLGAFGKRKRKGGRKHGHQILLHTQRHSRGAQAP